VICAQAARAPSKRSPEQAPAPPTPLGLGLVDGVSDIKRACYRNIRLPAFRLDCDLRGIWIIAALFFEPLSGF